MAAYTMSAFLVLCSMMALAIPFHETLVGVATRADCDGCAKESKTGLMGNVTVAGHLSVQNGQCDGVQPECQPTGCSYSAATITFTNISGAPLWYQENNSAIRTKIATGGNASIDIRDGTLACNQGAGLSSLLLITFYDAKTGGNLMGTWGWQCSICQ